MRRPTACLVHLARDVGGLAIDHAQSAPLLAIAHHDERPVLRIARRGRSNGGIQNAGDDLLRDGLGFEPAQGACGVDGVEQSDLRHRKPHSIFTLRCAPASKRRMSPLSACIESWASICSTSRSFCTGFKINILPDVVWGAEKYHIRIGGVDEP